MLTLQFPAVVENASTAAVDSAGEKAPRRSRNRATVPPAAEEPVLQVAQETELVLDLKVAMEEELEMLIEEVIELTVIEPVAEGIKEEVVEIPVAAPAPEPVPIAVIEAIVPVQEVVEVSPPKAFLKMGKWEAPESSAFQFGSFGNYNTDDTMSTPAPWGGAVAESEQQIQPDSAADVWGANGEVSSSSSGPSPMSSLFPVPKGLTSSSSEGSPSGVSTSSHIQNGRYDQQKPSAPPGLEISKPVARQDSRSAAPGQSQSRGKHEVNQQQLQQQQLQQQQQQQQQYQQPQYQQQAPAVTPASARGQVPAPSSMLYGYAPGFDSQYQQSSYGPPASTAPPPVTGSPVAAAGAAPTQGQGVAPGAPQTLQYGPPPGMGGHYVNPYYSPPYYGSQYFYGPSVLPNPYYNQGRGDYQSNRYPSDPYASAGQYPNVYHQGGGFSDQGMSMQQHPSMGQQNQVQGQSGSASAPGAPSAGGQGKQQKGASTASAPQQQDPNQGYVYNPYNPRDGQWQYGWNAPMMGFPGGSPTGAGGPQGFSQPPQQQQSGQGQRPSSSSYGGPAGQGQQSQGQQSFSRGSGVPNTTGPPSGGSTGQHW